MNFWTQLVIILMLTYYLFYYNQPKSTSVEKFRRLR